MSRADVRPRARLREGGLRDGELRGRFIITFVRRASGIVFWLAAAALLAMALFWLANLALGYVAVGGEIGRQLSQRLPGAQATFDKARVRLSLRGVFLRAQQLHLSAEGGGVFAEQADFFFGDDAINVSLRAPRLTIGAFGEVNNNNAKDIAAGIGGVLMLPVAGDEWSVVGSDAVLVLPENDFGEWLPTRAGDFTVVFRGGAMHFAFDERAGDSGEETSFVAEWQNGKGKARAVIARERPSFESALPARRFRLTANVNFDIGGVLSLRHSRAGGNDESMITVAVNGSGEEVRAGDFHSRKVAAALQAEVPVGALTEPGANIAVNVSALLMSAQLSGGATPPADISIAGVFNYGDGDWSLSASEVLFGNGDGAISASGVVGGGESLASVVVSGRAAVAAAALHHYLPPSQAQTWLNESLVGGGIGAAVFAVSGSADDLREGRGWGATAVFADGEIHIGAGWPRARALAGALFMQDDRLTIIGEGIFADLAVTDVTAVIDNLLAQEPASLRLDMRATPAPFAEYKRVAYSVTVLRDELSAAQTANLSGDAALALFLTVPLATPENVLYRASLAVRDGAFVLGAALPTLRALNGAVVANNKSVNGNFRARLYGERASFKFDGKGKATLASRIAASRALALAGGDDSVFNIARENIGGDALFTLRINGARTDIRADLENVNSNLPAPLRKPKDEMASLRLVLHAGSVSLSVTTGDAVVLFVKSKQGGAAAGINHPPPDIPTTGARIAGVGEEWNLDEWLQFSGVGGDGETGAAVSLSLKDSTLMGIQHEFLDVSMSPPANGARVAVLRSPFIKGTLQIQPGTVRGDLDELIFPDFECKGDSCNENKNANTEPATAENDGADLLVSMSLSLKARRLAVGGITLGGMTLSGEPQGDGWRIKRMVIQDGENILRFAGFGARDGTTLTADLSAPDLPRLLAQFKLPGLIESGSLTMRGRLSWSDAPSSPSLAGLRGDLHLTADDVRYLRLQEGVTGLLALFSPASLFSLGFTELGRPGVSFDIGGDIALADGFAESESLTMSNDDIHITLGGRTDMVRRRHNIKGRVLPGNRLMKTGSAVSLGASLAVGAAINPPVFLASVLLGKILEKPLAEIGAYDYEITGDWNTPNYRELGFTEPEQS